MKKKQKTRFSFKIPIFEFTVLMVFQNDNDDINFSLKNAGFLPLENLPEEINEGVAISHPELPVFFAVIFHSRTTLSTFVHELSHLIDYMMNFLENTDLISGSETRAYLTEYCFKKFYKATQHLIEK